jgi:hypothetical protein
MKVSGRKRQQDVADAAKRRILEYTFEIGVGRPS